MKKLILSDYETLQKKINEADEFNITLTNIHSSSDKITTLESTNEFFEGHTEIINNVELSVI